MKKSVKLFLSAGLVLVGALVLSVMSFAGNKDISSIEFYSDTPLTMYENLNGQVLVDAYGNEYFHYDSPNIFKDNTAFILYYTDGTQDKFAYFDDVDNFVSESGEELDKNSIVVGYAKDQIDNHWDYGGRNQVTVAYKGFIYRVTLIIEKADVTEISVTLPDAVEIFENTRGYKASDGNYIYYEHNLLPLGTELKITGAEGEITFILGEKGFESLNGECFEKDYFRVFSNQSAEPWSVGENLCYAEYMGKSADFAVIIKENNLLKFEFVPKVPVAFTQNINGAISTDALGKEFFEYNTENIFCQGDVLRLTYSSGEKEYAFNGDKNLFEAADGEQILPSELTVYDFQNSSHWEIGGDNQLFIELFGVSDVINVEIKPEKEGLYLKEINGVLTCFEDGEINSNYEGFVPHNGTLYYVCNGAFDPAYTGLVNYENVWMYAENGVFNGSATTLVLHYGLWYYVENGYLNWNATTLTNYYGVWYYVENGVLNHNSDTLILFDGNWYYARGGTVAWDYTGLVLYYGAWYYIENGVLNWGATMLTNYYGVWYYVENGVLNWNSDTLVEYYGNWYYARGGTVAWDYTGLVCYYDVWYYVENGVLNWGATTLTEYYGVWYYVENGILNWGATTLTEYYGTWYYVENGVLNWNSNTLVFYNGSWFYTYGGTVAWWFTGYVNYYGTNYYISGGVLR